MARPFFRVGYVIKARDGHCAYRVTSALGEGGFAQTFRADELTPKGRRRKSVCLKVMTDADAWHGGSYFGSLARGMDNVVQLRDSFPYRMRSGMRFVLVLDLMTGGTVGDWLESGPKPWTSGQVINALRGLCRTVGAFHASGASHRDITPANVFMLTRRRLCLGDFGIARHGLNGRGPFADAFNAGFVATSMFAGARREWLPSDDAYQLGLIGLNLLLAEYIEDVDWRSLRHQVEHSDLRAVLQRATGPRAGRYESAVAMWEDLAAIRNRAE